MTDLQLFIIRLQTHTENTCGKFKLSKNILSYDSENLSRFSVKAHL